VKKTDKKTKALSAIAILEQKYPDAICSLEYNAPHELLICARLSAQCTDERVNKVVPALFKRYPTVAAFAQAEVSDVEEFIRTCGLYKTKAKDIVAACRMLDEKYGGELPDSVEELIKLPGVGRKTANLVVGDIFGKPSIVCDTHCIRITNLIGLADSKDPFKVEQQLREILPPESSGAFCHRLVLFGREVCVARRPACEKCPLAFLCEHALSNSSTK